LDRPIKKYLRKNKLKVNEYEKICPKCGGKGHIYAKHKIFSNLIVCCDNCKGTGKIDWVDIIKKRLTK